jgi:histidinol-phosphate aminotransferase
MIRLPMSDTLAYRKLMARGIMVRTMTGFRFPNFVRVTLSVREALEAFVAALDAVLAERAGMRSG